MEGNHVKKIVESPQTKDQKASGHHPEIGGPGHGSVELQAYGGNEILPLYSKVLE